MGGRPGWIHERVLVGADHFLDALCQAIAGSCTSVDLESYIFERDSLGERVLQVMKDAVSRGVRVRLLLDGFGSANWTTEDSKECESLGIQVRIFHPLPWQTRHVSLHLSARKAILGFSKLNRRNHRKSCVIDGTIAFVGGQNITEKHRQWRDLTVQVEGPGVAVLASAFEALWHHPRGWRAAAVPSQNLEVYLNANRHQRKANHRELQNQMRQARTRIWIANAYFIPDPKLILELRSAALRGVDVKLLFSHQSDVMGMNWAMGAYYASLLSAGVEIYEYKPTVLHSKLILIDHWARVGSSNLNHRSLFHDFEADIILRRLESVKELEDLFLKDLVQSRRVHLKRWLHRHWVRRFIEKLSVLIRHWI